MYVKQIFPSVNGKNLCPEEGRKRGQSEGRSNLKKHAVNAKVCSGCLELGCKFDKASATCKLRAFHISR